MLQRGSQNHLHDSPAVLLRKRTVVRKIKKMASKKSASGDDMSGGKKQDAGEAKEVYTMGDISSDAPLDGLEGTWF